MFIIPSEPYIVADCMHAYINPYIQTCTHAYTHTEMQIYRQTDRPIDGPTASMHVDICNYTCAFIHIRTSLQA